MPRWPNTSPPTISRWRGVNVRAFITGANGFVGRHLASYLTRSGDHVVGVDRECDVTSLPTVIAKLREDPPDVLYHLAAMTHVGDSWRQPEEFTRVNVLGTINVLKAAGLVAPASTIVMVSSADVYGIVQESDLPLGEERPPRPANPYAQSKVEAELQVRDAAGSSGHRVIIARPFNHVGPGQSVQFVIPALVERLLTSLAEGANEIRVGDLTTRRDFSDVRDVVRAYRLLARFAVTGEVYNVASGHDVALADVAEQLVNLIAPGTRLVLDPDLVRPVEVPVMRGDFTKLHETTGWEPTIDLVTSLRDVVAERRRARSGG